MIHILLLPVLLVLTSPGLVAGQYSNPNDYGSCTGSTPTSINVDASYCENNVNAGDTCTMCTVDCSNGNDCPETPDDFSELAYCIYSSMFVDSNYYCLPSCQDDSDCNNGEANGATCTPESTCMYNSGSNNPPPSNYNPDLAYTIGYAIGYILGACIFVALVRWCCCSKSKRGSSSERGPLLNAPLDVVDGRIGARHFRAGETVYYTGNPKQWPDGDRVMPGMQGTVIGCANNNKIDVLFHGNRDNIAIGRSNLSRFQPPIVAGSNRGSFQPSIVAGVVAGSKRSSFTGDIPVVIGVATPVAATAAAAAAGSTPTAAPAVPSAPAIDHIPPLFTCPLSGALMKDPVQLVDGKTYERLNVEFWLAQGNTTSPLPPHAPLQSTAIFPNLALKVAIDSYTASL